MLTLAPYSVGVGDRFAHQARAQLRACLLAAGRGVEVVPVWNKSNREHTIIGSEPSATRAAADAAVRELGWTRPYHLDADHIRLETVDRFLAPCDYFTIDVADSIGQPAEPAAARAFIERHKAHLGRIEVMHEGAKSFWVKPADLQRVAEKYLKAVQDAGAIYRKIAAAKGEGTFITEVSMDETDSPQTPAELLFILAGLADEGVPVQTIAPKFTGRFNKGVDYVGDVEQFEREFRQDLVAIQIALSRYNLPSNLKVSVHSGSDKFSLYEPMRRAIRSFRTGLHLKTAGTTWLEEVIGLAEADGDGLALAKEIYARALTKQDELCAPYATVIDIDPTKLPGAEEVGRWTAEQFVGALRHDPANPAFNPHLRQLVHVGFKVAAQMGDRYLRMLRECEPTIARNVTGNLYERHLKPLFVEK